jgi:hypothetical protein
MHAATMDAMLALADQHDCSNLRDTCGNHIANCSSRAGGAKARQQYQCLERSWGSMFSYLWEKATKLGVFLFIMKYIIC